jgi:type I restriction enzyme S subunit
MANTTWRKLALGEVITLQRGYDLPHKERKHGTVPIISSSGSIDTHNESRAPGPGVVTGRYGTIGEVFFISEDFWPLNTTLFVKDFKGNNPLFISFLLRTIDYHSYSGKSGVPGVNRNDLHEISVCLPPLPEQQAIATALSDVDTLIASLDKLIAKKRAIKQATMQQLLTGKRRLPGFSKELNVAYKQTEIGMIPVDWEVHSVEEIADVTTGNKDTQDRVESGAYPFFVRSQIVERINSYSYNGEAVLTAGDGVGVGKVFHYVNGKFDFHQRVYMIYNFRNFDGFFFFLYFSNHFYKEATKYNAKNSVDSVRREMITGMKIPYPPLPEQQAIATVLSDMDAEIVALERRRDKTRALKQGMMQELLTGKTRLR